MVFIEEIEDENAPTVEELKAQIAQTMREREDADKGRLREKFHCEAAKRKLKKNDILFSTIFFKKCF